MRGRSGFRSGKENTTASPPRKAVMETEGGDEGSEEQKLRIEGGGGDGEGSRGREKLLLIMLRGFSFLPDDVHSSSP